MAPYNSYTSYSPSSTSLYTATRNSKGSFNYNSTLSSRYKPPTFSSTVSASKYRSPSTYSSPSSYCSQTVYPSATNRKLQSSDLISRFEKLSTSNSYPSYGSDVYTRKTSKAVNDYSISSPALSRRSSSVSSLTRTSSDKNFRASLPTFLSESEKPPLFKVNSWACNLSDEKENRSGRVGLNNLGNTCFMNSVLQCLCHTEPLVDYCVKGSYLREINHRSPSRGDLMRVFAEFLNKMTDTKTKSAFSPYQLRTEVQRYAPRFSGDSQQDAQEFLRYLLQGLHDDINRVKFKSNRLNDCRGDANRSWKKYNDTDDSLIVDLFAGQLKSTLKCNSCNSESITYDPFMDLSLPLPEQYRNASLRQCFSLFSYPEILDGANKPFCEVCKRKTVASKKMEVHKFPKVLVIHLKRFSPSCYGQKLNTMIDCPLTLGKISESASHNSTGDELPYNLYGVVDHDGSNNSGHYIAKCKHPTTKEWFEFNDSRVSKSASIVTSKSYILFYIQERSFNF